ncbi:MAG: methionyl-tRNA formyltransferase, partial [Betaproteobacteria bacterium]
DGPSVTYAHKLAKDEARLDFTQPAARLARQVRAFDPFPVASAPWRGEALRIWRAQALDQATAAAPGTVLQADATGVRVATGHGILLLQELQRAGGRRLAARDFLAGNALVPGERLGAWD